MEEVKPESWKPTLTNVPNFRSQLWNPTRRLATQLREKIQQPYAHTVRFLHNEMSLAGQYFRCRSLFIFRDISHVHRINYRRLYYQAHRSGQFGAVLSNARNRIKRTNDALIE